jgi:hypothetical protein
MATEDDLRLRILKGELKIMPEEEYQRIIKKIYLDIDSGEIFKHFIIKEGKLPKLKKWKK